MKHVFVLLFVLLIAGSVDAVGQPNEPTPYVGYVYPAGAQRGTTVTVVAGGQYLRGARGAWVSGAGVRATSVRYLGPLGHLSNDQVRELARKIREAYRARARAARRRSGHRPSKREKVETGKQQKKKAPAKKITLPDLPLLQDIGDRTPRELTKIANEFLDPIHRQRFNRQIAELVEVQFVLAPNAPVGPRDLRIETPRGLTNPIRFEVGELPEFDEKEINDFVPEELPTPSPAFVLNGQVGYRDVDRFRFKAKKGEKLVIDAGARRLVPFLADAVPGWFQAVLSLKDDGGKEVAYDDDYRFDPDPVLFYEVPRDGEYELQIRDAIYRGRADFVYRLTIGKIPFATRMFPISARTGSKVSATLGGVNLAVKHVLLDTTPGPKRWREVALVGGSPLVRPMRYEVSDLPETVEKEPNDSISASQPITLPQVVDGRIGRAGDVDSFRIVGRAGQEVVAEVTARRLGSPLDSLVRIKDASGKILAWNDDFDDPAFDLVTDQADSYVRYRLPADGTYYVEVSDVQHHGGPEYTYRLRLSAPRPDFTVLMTPSALNVPAGGTVPATIHVIRRDGYAGPVDLALVGAPPGVVLCGGRVPTGAKTVEVTVSAPTKSTKQPIPLTVRASAQIEGRGAVSHSVIPADRRMQAFAYWHLVPAHRLLMDVTRRRARLGALATSGSTPIHLLPGGTAKVVLRAPGRRGLRGLLPDPTSLSFDLASAPPGVTLQSVGFGPRGLTLWLTATRSKKKATRTGNLVVDVYLDRPIPARKSGRRRSAKVRRYYLGVLPAIPVVVTGR